MRTAAKRFRLFTALSLFCIFLTSSSFLYADLAGQPETCVITIESVWLKNKQGDWIKIISPDKQVDITSYEASVSFFNKDNRIPEDDYVNVKVVISEWIRVSGEIAQPSAESSMSNYTKEGGSIRVVGTASQSSALPGQLKKIQEMSPTWTGREKEKGEIRVHLDLDNGDDDEIIQILAASDFEKPIRVKKNVFVNVLVRLDLNGSLRYAWQDDYASGVPSKSVFYFMPQNNPELVHIKVGETVLDLDQQHVRMVF